METRAHYVAVGLFVIALLIAGAGVILWLGRVEFSSELQPYYIFFKGSVAGLSKGSAVQYNGIPVGRVTDIRVDPDNVAQIQVTVEIDGSLVSIKSDARAFLDTNLLSGVSTVQIRGGTQQAVELRPEPGHKYPIIKAGQSEIEQVKASLPEILGELKTVAANLRDLLSPENRQAVTDSLKNVRIVTQAVADHSKDIGKILTDADATVVELRMVLHNVGEGLVGRGGLKDDAAKTLADYDRLAKNLLESSHQLQAMLQEGRPAVRSFRERTLPAIDDLVNDAEQFVSGLTRLANEIERDPTRLLFGDRREGYKPQ
ncbi:MAG TPA: MlaD family protein [Stellaceae bacterium]|jgi:phospholipid/cholesterol/gamma-HCH transport system substrate-binding protein|nr:MlaD family protein [Stellaceae bacterium]